MPNLLTADQFVAGIISTLALKNHRNFEFKDTELDRMFEKAFGVLVERKDDLQVTPTFTFVSDPLHGDSIALRETLLAAKEKELISLNNPTFHTFSIKLDDDRARRYLSRLPLDNSFLSEIVDRFFHCPATS